MGEVIRIVFGVYKFSERFEMTHDECVECIRFLLWRKGIAIVECR